MRPRIVHLERHAVAELPAQRSLQAIIIRTGNTGYFIRVKRRIVVNGIER